jgi:hypothetical protein
MDPIPDPTPFFNDFKDAKKNFSPYFSFITCPQAHHLQYKKFNFWLKFCVKNFIGRHCFNPLNTFMRKGKDPDSYLTNGSGPGSRRPKNMWIRFRIRIPNNGSSRGLQRDVVYLCLLITPRAPIPPESRGLANRLLLLII